MTDQIDTYKLAVSRYVLTQKIPNHDPLWPRFNASFDNVEMGVSRVVEAIYEGHPITTQHKNHWREGCNYICGQYLGLDFDTEDERSTLEHLKNDFFIGRYATFLYTTISHTMEAPRARAIFMLDRPIMQGKNYAMAATALVWLFGQADRKCKDCCRFFYGSPNCNVEMINNILPIEVIQHLIAQYAESGKREKKNQETFTAPVELREVQGALDLIPAYGIDYDEWLQVLMGIHAQFGQAGLGMAESWGQGLDGEIDQKWRSFDAKGNEAGAVTIATVFGIAKRFGWHKTIDN